MSRAPYPFLLAVIAVVAAVPVQGQSGSLGLPKSVDAGSAFSIPTEGSGKAVLYIAGPAQVLKRDVQLGQPIAFSGGDLDNAGHYIVVLSSESSTVSGEFDVRPAIQPAAVSFLARPSRLPVGLQNGITGAVYVFDAYRNLITSPASVNFQLSVPSVPVQARTVVTNQGAAWTEMNSAEKEGTATFSAQVGNVSATRVIQQVPGDPCGLKMTAHKVGDHVDLQTDPLRDCSGNAVSDGTIVTFTESWNGSQTTVDVPLKRGIAQVAVPAVPGARISVATGVVMGNEIRWGSQQ